MREVVKENDMRRDRSKVVPWTEKITAIHLEKGKDEEHAERESVWERAPKEREPKILFVLLAKDGTTPEPVRYKIHVRP